MKYIFGVYSHYSQGTADDDFKSLVNLQLKPLLTLAFNNPDFRFVMRLSVSLVQWIDKNCTEINMLIGNLCRRGQLELLSSSFYDSIIQLCPPNERSSQLEKTNTFFRREYLKRPHGLWCIGQVFSSSLLNIAHLSSLDYFILSSFNQLAGLSVTSKPFRMNEFDKETVVFPSDAKISEAVAGLSKHGDSESFCEEVINAVKSMNSPVNTIMMNLDQMLRCPDSSDVFSSIIKIIHKKTVLPYEFLSEHEITNRFYIPDGIYGYDFKAGKNLTINQNILSTPVLNRFYCCLNMLREASRSFKKNSDDKKTADSLIMRASSGLIYIPDNYKNNELFTAHSRALCELEAFIASQGFLPYISDTANDGNVEFISQNKNYICYLSTYGAQITRVNIVSLLPVFTVNEADLFHDYIKTDKTVDLGLKIWKTSPLNKKHLEFSAECPSVSAGKTQLVVKKYFKFRLNSISVKYEITNIGNTDLTDCIFEIAFKALFSHPIVSGISDCSADSADSAAESAAEPSAGSASVSSDVVFEIDGKIVVFLLHTSDKVVVETDNSKGQGSDTEHLSEFRKLKINRNISISAKQTCSFSVIIKSEKKEKQKNNSCKDTEL